jgi:hypothetical protein
MACCALLGADASVGADYTYTYDLVGNRMNRTEAITGVTDCFPASSHAPFVQQSTGVPGLTAYFITDGKRISTP